MSILTSHKDLLQLQAACVAEAVELKKKYPDQRLSSNLQYRCRRP